MFFKPQDTVACQHGARSFYELTRFVLKARMASDRLCRVSVVWILSPLRPLSYE